MTIQAIETKYNGYRFRSRLEARWAVFFDALGIKYQYEPEGYDLGVHGWYLPDFWMEWQYHIEIKPSSAPEQYSISDVEKRLAFLSQHPRHNIVLVCGTPGIREYTVCEFIRGKKTTPRIADETFSLLRMFYSAIDIIRLGMDVQRGYTAARSARFEHGETPILPAR